MPHISFYRNCAPPGSLANGVTVEMLYSCLLTPVITYLLRWTQRTFPNMRCVCSQQDLQKAQASL